jgi:hypothetical protein
MAKRGSFSHLVTMLRSGGSYRMNEFHKVELEEIFSRLQAIDSIRIQLVGFVGGANLTALGFAFTTRNVSLIFIAALSVAIYIGVDAAQRRNVAALCFRGFQLQELYARDDVYSSLFLYNPEIASRALDILKRTNPSDQIRQLSLVPLKYLNPSGFWLPLFVIVLEVGIAILLWLQGWRFA